MYDFSGYATKNDLECGDGRIIRRDAFKDNDNTRVPLVWQHIHNDPGNVLGHADLEIVVTVFTHIANSTTLLLVKMRRH